LFVNEPHATPIGPDEIARQIGIEIQELRDVGLAANAGGVFENDLADSLGGRRVFS
jgi:hypothetical protein